MSDAAPLSPEEERRLLEAATAVRLNAYAPYSNFLVGAALLDSEGRIWSGCNVESASYGLTICAERNAVFKAISEGARGFRGVAVVIEGPEPGVPCGACRQVLWDQCRDIPVLAANTAGALLRMPLSFYLPRAFELGGPR